MMQSPTGSAAFEYKSAVSATGNVVHASDLGFSNNESAACTFYRAVELIVVVRSE
jgi:hypothetical protein